MVNLNSIEKLHKKEIKKAEDIILSNLQYLIRAYVQIELYKILNEKPIESKKEVKIKYDRTNKC